MSAKNIVFMDAINYRARRTGVHEVSPKSKSVTKKIVSRGERANNKQVLRHELQNLADSQAHDVLIERHENARFDFSAYDLEEMADRLLEESGLSSFDEPLEDVGSGRSVISLELQGSLPDWLLAQMEAANGNAFAYLSLLEEKRPRSTGGLLAEELAEMA